MYQRLLRAMRGLHRAIGGEGKRRRDRGSSVQSGIGGISWFFGDHNGADGAQGVK